MKCLLGRSVVVAATVLLPLLLGCSERVLIKTYPPGAKVFVNDRLVGLSPVTYSASRSEVSAPHAVRIEKEGFEVVRTSLETRVPGGRVVAGVFTLGALYLLRSPWSFRTPEPFMLTEALTEDGHDRALGRRLRLLQNQEPNAVIVVPPTLRDTPPE